MVFRRAAVEAIGQQLAQVRCRVALFRGELSDLVTPDVADYMFELLDRNAPQVEIPQAHHHLLARPAARVRQRAARDPRGLGALAAAPTLAARKSMRSASAARASASSGAKKRLPRATRVA